MKYLRYKGATGMQRKFAALVVASIIGLMTSTSVVAGTILSTGFESPDFSIGATSGQGGWVGNGDIQSAVVSSGTQAAHVGGSGFSAATHSMNAVASGSITFEADFFRSGTSTTQAGISVSGDTGFIAQIATIGNTFQVLGNANSATTPQPFAKDVWNNLRIEFDFASLTMEGFVNDISTGTLSINPVGGPPTTITNIGFYSFGSDNGDIDVYLDNVAVSVPEPGALTLLLAGLLGLARLTRRRTI